MQARQAAENGDDKAVADVEAQVELESARLWSLSVSTIAEIQRGLKELCE